MNALLQMVQDRAAWSLFLAIAFALGQTGCILSESRNRMYPAPPSETVRAGLGTIGIISVGGPTNVTLAMPMTPSGGAASGAAAGAVSGLLAGGEGGPLGLIVGAVVFAPLGAIIGGVEGHAQGLASTKLDEADRELRAAILESKLQETLVQEVWRTACLRTRHRVVLDRAKESPPPGPREGSPPSASTAVETALEISVLGAGLNGPSAKTARLSAFTVVRVRLVRVRDGTELYVHTRFSQSGARTFLEWAASHARALREELAQMIPRLAVSMVEELFLNYDPKQSGRPFKSGE